MKPPLLHVTFSVFPLPCPALTSGADRAARTSRGHQALHVAAENGHTETVRVLLDNGADPNAKDQVGWDAENGARKAGAGHGSGEGVNVLMFFVC